MVKAATYTYLQTLLFIGLSLSQRAVFSHCVALLICLCRDHRAVGVEYADASEHGAKVSSVYAKRLVVVSAGAFGSPAILQRSGIGASQLLKELDINQQVDLPGVGENYQGTQRTLGPNLIELKGVASDHNLGFATYFVPDSMATLDVFSGNLGEDALKSQYFSAQVYPALQPALTIHRLCGPMGRTWRWPTSYQVRP